MGNYRSGRWQEYRKKTTVEESLPLDVRISLPRQGLYAFGNLAWTTSSHQTIATVGFETDIREQNNANVHLCYEVNSVGQAVDYRIALTTTRPQFGGLRWWFVCPLIVDGKTCGKRAGKLFLPP